MRHIKTRGGHSPKKVIEGVRGSSISSSNTCSNLCCFLQEFGCVGGGGGGGAGRW